MSLGVQLRIYCTTLDQSESSNFMNCNIKSEMEGEKVLTGV